MLSFFDFASSQALSTARTPGASTAMGFSAKTCLPAATAAWMCAGRKPGAAAGVHVAGEEGAGGHAGRGARLEEIPPRGGRWRRLRHAFDLLEVKVGAISGR